MTVLFSALALPFSLSGIWFACNGEYGMLLGSSVMTVLCLIMARLCAED